MQFCPELEIKEITEGGKKTHYLEDKYEHFKIFCTSKEGAENLKAVIDFSVFAIAID